MQKVRFVFYRAKFDLINVMRGKRKAHLIDDGISLWTGLFNWFTPGYSHVEVWIPNANGEFVYEVDLLPADRDNLDVLKAGYDYRGTCYTSTMRGKDNGTVSRPASEVFKHPERWEYIEFEVTDESFAEAKTWADERVKNNKGYSMKDIRRFFLPLPVLKFFKWDDPTRDICSEFGEGMAIRLYQISYAIGKYLLWYILIRSPRRLWHDLVKRHHVVTRSVATNEIVRDERGRRVKHRKAA